MPEATEIKKTGASSAGDGRADPTPELKKLLELSTRYPEIGPPVAELAFKLGQREIGERLVRMGTDGQKPGLEYYFVTAHAAKREGRFTDALRISVDALQAFAEAPDDAIAPEDGGRLLHLLRSGFATLMFELADVKADPSFAADLTERLPELEARLGGDPFYRTLMAQALWYQDVEKSEAEWDRAAELGDAELTWNARGTWYKEAERDRKKAERAYRKGLEAAPKSALLLHNLAQVLVDRAETVMKDARQARKLLSEADDLLRAALREDAPKVRRHIHATRDRLHELRRKLPKPPRRAQGGADPRQKRGGKGEGKKGGKPQPRSFQTDGKIRLGDVLMNKLKEQSQGQSQGQGQDQDQGQGSED